VSKPTLWVVPTPNQSFPPPEGPTPGYAGFKTNMMYMVLDIHDNGNIASEAYFSLINEFGEVWFISNRHFRVVEVYRGDTPHPVTTCLPYRQDGGYFYEDAEVVEYSD
jgi:hypothetical protein